MSWALLTLLILSWKPIYWVAYKGLYLKETSYYQDTKEWFKSLWNLVSPMELINEWRAQVPRKNA